MKRFVAGIFLFSGVWAISAYAQEAAKLSSAADTSEMAQAPAEMQSLVKALSGTWNVTMKFEPDGANPNAASKGEQSSKGYGQQIWRAGPGGLTFIDEERMHMPFGPVNLVGFMWWDSTTKHLRGMECTNQNPAGCDVQGSLNGVSLKWDGKELVIDMTSEKNGKKSVWHETFAEITPTSFTQTGYSGDGSGPLKKVVTIHGVRAAK